MIYGRWLAKSAKQETFWQRLDGEKWQRTGNVEAFWKISEKLLCVEFTRRMRLQSFKSV